MAKRYEDMTDQELIEMATWTHGFISDQQAISVNDIARFAAAVSILEERGYTVTEIHTLSFTKPDPDEEEAP